jgi:hypothetical protein
MLITLPRIAARALLITLALFSFKVMAQQRAVFIYPSWEAPKVVLITAGDSECPQNNVRAIHTNGVLRLYTYRPPESNPRNCTTIALGRDAQLVTSEQVIDLRRICTGTNCEEPIHRAEFYQQQTGFNYIDQNCVRTQGSTYANGVDGDRVPCAPTNAQDGPLFRYRAVGPTPIFPLPNRGVYSGRDNGILVPQEIAVIPTSGFYNFEEGGVWGLEFMRIGSTLRTMSAQYVGAEAAVLAKFYRSGAIELRDYPNVAQPTPISLSTLRPGAMLVTLDGRLVPTYEFGASFSVPPSANLTERLFIWPRLGGLFDVRLPELPFRQFKLGACVANSDKNQPVRNVCPASFDNGTRGQLVEYDGLRFQLAYATCRGTQSIELAPEGFGQFEWYVENRGPDPYAGTAMELKRGQMRVKLFASKRDGEFDLTPGPGLKCRRRMIAP